MNFTLKMINFQIKSYTFVYSETEKETKQLNNYIHKINCYNYYYRLNDSFVYYSKIEKKTQQ